MPAESLRSCELFEEFKRKYESGYRYVVTLNSGWRKPDKCKIISYYRRYTECTTAMQSFTVSQRSVASFHCLSVLIQKPVYFFGEHGVDKNV